MKPNTRSWSYLNQFFLESGVSGKSCRENQNTHSMFRNLFLENQNTFYVSEYF